LSAKGTENTAPAPTPTPAESKVLVVIATNGDRVVVVAIKIVVINKSIGNGAGGYTDNDLEEALLVSLAAGGIDGFDIVGSVRITVGGP
jgi:hypothetical protein